MGPLIQVRACAGSGSVDAIKFQVWRTKILNRLRVGLAFQAARRIEGNVVIDELAEEREACRQSIRVLGILDRAIHWSARRSGVHKRLWISTMRLQMTEETAEASAIIEFGARAITPA
jgi:hypothetical protein